jgi:arabinogalactan endo-1,4-beta-galactosidase
LETVKSLAKEAQNLGLKILLTIHYSDNWADPEKQIKPRAWEDLTLSALEDSVYSYTSNIVKQINPEYVQIGNEINNGILWPEGNAKNQTNLQGLIKSGIKAVRDFNPKTKIVLHYAGHHLAKPFFDYLSITDFDIIGLSYYPNWHGRSLDSLSNNIDRLSEAYQKPIFIAETSYPFTLGYGDYTNNVIGTPKQILDSFPPTQAGQKAFLTTIKNLMVVSPWGIGYCYWGAEWVAYKGSTSTNGSTWENQALWDLNYQALPVLEVYGEN